MSEIGHELVLPQSGVIVNLEDEVEVARALREVQDLKVRLLQAERGLREALGARASVLGTKTLHVEGVGKVEIKNAQIIEWDDTELELGLRAAGCPEDVIGEIITETVIRKVNAVRAERAAKANPEYAEVIVRCKTVREKLPSVSIT